MNICSKCGEYTKVRKRITFNGELYPSAFGSYNYIYICKRCEDAEIIICKKYIEDQKLEDKKKREDWIKMRDKLLEEELIKKGRDIFKLEQYIKKIKRK